MMTHKIPGWFHRNPEDRPTFQQLLIALIGSFSAIGVAGYLSMQQGLALLIPSFGASAVLLFAASQVPMARPRRVLGGHIISAIIGVTVYQFLGLAWWTLSLGISLAILCMMVTDTLHPPGGATAFAAVYSHQNYMFIFMPVALGIIILVIVAFIVHQLYGRNLAGNHR